MVTSPLFKVTLVSCVCPKGTRHNIDNWLVCNLQQMGEWLLRIIQSIGCLCFLWELKWTRDFMWFESFRRNMSREWLVVNLMGGQYWSILSGQIWREIRWMEYQSSTMWILPLLVVVLVIAVGGAITMMIGW